jgi:hypothetical protein
MKRAWTSATVGTLLLLGTTFLSRAVAIEVADSAPSLSESPALDSRASISEENSEAGSRLPSEGNLAPDPKVLPCILPAATCSGCNPFPTSYRPRSPARGYQGFYVCPPDQCSLCGWKFCSELVCECGTRLMKSLCDGFADCGEE